MQTNSPHTFLIKTFSPVKVFTFKSRIYERTVLLKSDFLNTDSNALSPHQAAANLSSLYLMSDFLQSWEAVNTLIPSILININMKHAPTHIYENTHNRGLATAPVAACGLTEIYERCKVCGEQHLSARLSLYWARTAAHRKTLCQLISWGFIFVKSTNQPMLMFADLCFS